MTNMILAFLKSPTPPWYWQINQPSFLVILTDVIVKFEDVYYQVDFLVLDYVFSNKNKPSNVILGRPFLATAGAQIDCISGGVEMAFGNRKMKIKAFKSESDSSFPVNDGDFLCLMLLMGVNLISLRRTLGKLFCFVTG